MATSDRLNWTIFTLRWLIVLGGLSIIFLQHDQISNVAPALLPATLIVLAFYNLLTALVLLVGGRGPLFNAGTVLLDMVATVALFAGTGGTALMLVGAGLLPVVIGTWRYRVTLGLVIITVLALGCFGVTF